MVDGLRGLKRSLSLDKITDRQSVYIERNGIHLYLVYREGGEMG